MEKAKMTEHTFMIIAALVIGTTAGFGAIFIRSMITWITNLGFPGDGNVLANIIAA